MNIWREDHPSLPSERPEDERNTYLVRWQLGLAGLYAEAENPSWATTLTEEEAKLAARYALIELNELPLWMGGLVDAYPEAVEAILGNELSWELKREPRAHGRSMLLQEINYAPEPIAKLFLPRLREWLDGDGDVIDDAGDLAGVTDRLRQVIGDMLKHGDEDTRAYVLTVARQRLQNNLPEELILFGCRRSCGSIPTSVYPRLSIVSERSSRERIVKLSNCSAFCSTIVTMRSI